MIDDVSPILSAVFRTAKKEAPILPEAQIARLYEAAPRYRAACPFRPDDLITARADSSSHPDLIGRPHLVLEVLAEPRLRWNAATALEYGDRVDMRVLVIIHDRLVTVWKDSADYELLSEFQKANAPTPYDKIAGGLVHG